MERSLVVAETTVTGKYEVVSIYLIRERMNYVEEMDMIDSRLCKNGVE